MTAAQTATGGAAIQNPAPEDYFLRAIPEPVRVLGLALRPMSLGHYRLLKRFQVAFVSDETATANVSDLLTGVLICSMPVDEFIAFASSKSFTQEVRRWSKKLFPAVWICSLPFIGNWWRKRHGFNVLEKMAIFQKYIASAQRIPNYTCTQNSPGKNSGHWSHSIEICLRSELGWTAQEINEQPLSKALADYFRFAESNGMVILLQDADLAAADHNAERIAEALKAANLN